MNLKNRTLVLLTAVAIAVPAVAYAKKHHKGKDKDGKATSEIRIAGAAPAVPFTAVSKDSNINVTDDGTNTIVKIDGTNLKTGLDKRDEHMRERVFKSGKYVEVIVANSKIEQGLKDKKINAIVKMHSTKAEGETITIENFSKDGDKVHGDINTTLAALGLKNVCKEIIGDLKVCVKEPLKISADIYIKAD